MKKFQGLLLITVMIFFGSCNPRISTNLIKTYPPVDYKQEIIVLGLNEPMPENAEVLGEVKTGDSGFSTNCGYDVVIDKAKLEARKAGGNGIKIVEHKPPTALGSSCHRITAKILKIENTETYISKAEEEILHDADYAILNIYRYSGAGALLSYDLFLGDSLLCKVKQNQKTTLYIRKDGLNTIWAETEVKTEVPINVKLGKTYYLRCGISMGLFVGRPVLELVDYKTGKLEFEAFKTKNK